MGPAHTPTALIIGDVQTGIVEAFPPAASVLEPLARVVAGARASGVPVIYIRAALRPDRSEVSGRNAAASWMLEQGDLFQESSPATAIHPDIAPRPDEAVVTKRRGSGFTGTDLDAILRARGVTEFALAGVATSGVVLATLIDAAERDYAVTVLRDGCADVDQELHEFLMDRLFPRGAQVVDGAAWLDQVRDPTPR